MAASWRKGFVWKLTFIVIDPIVAATLQLNITPRTVPTTLTHTLPGQLVACTASTVTSTVTGTTYNQSINKYYDNYQNIQMNNFCWILPSKVQCFPFHPFVHKHVPLEQLPCALQRGSHSRTVQRAPLQPGAQEQDPPSHSPCSPQSRLQRSKRI